MKKYLPIADYAYCVFLKNHFTLSVLRIKDKEELKTKEKIHVPFSNFLIYKSINTAYIRTGSLFQEHLQRNRMKNEAYLKHSVCPFESQNINLQKIIRNVFTFVLPFLFVK
jgi:hypothetical protein